MKYQGKDIEKSASQVVLLTRETAGGEKRPDIRITVRALPLGFEEGAEKDIPSPAPRPLGFLYDRKNKPLRDPETGKPLLRTNEESSEFRLEIALVNRLQSVRMIYHAIKDDDNIEFSTDPELLERDPSAFYDSIYGEMRDAGFTAGDYLKLIRAVLESSGLSQEDVQEAVDDFLSGVGE
jgi:hypothetical protein